MNNFSIKTLVIAVSFAFSAGAMAQSMSKAEYKASKDKISAEYKVNKANCKNYSDNSNDICVAEAKGVEAVAKAELENSYKPSIKNHYDARITKAETDFAVAKEKCDDKDGNAKDVCLKEAKAIETTGKAEAKAQFSTAAANTQSNEQAAEARGEANQKIGAALKEATAEENEAAYSVAKEKCGAYASTAKDSCLTQARARYGKS